VSFYTGLHELGYRYPVTTDSFSHERKGVGSRNDSDEFIGAGFVYVFAARDCGNGY